MRMGDDYSPAGGGELADFGTYLGVGGGPTRWGSAQGGPTWGRSTPQHHHTSRFQTTSTNNCYEAEDIMYGAEHTRSCPTGSLRGRSGLYYSPPGTSYTIVERPSSTMGMHHHRDREYIQQYNKMAAASPRGTYLGASTTAVQSTRASSSAAVANTINKKRPISPEQVLKMFGNGHPASANHTTSSSKVVPAATTGTRRSPASSPASTTHQVYGAGGASVTRTGGAATGVYPSPQISIHELSTRTVTMTREPADGTHGFGICVKGGKDAGVGVYISRVEEGSVAERAGLRPGDSILEVNGTPFTAISHEEALKMLKSCRKLSMTVRSPTLPGTAAAASALGAGSYVVRQTCSWMDRQGRPVSPPIEYRRARPPPGGPGTGAVRRVDLCIEPGQSLGLMIRGGVEYNLGIFITGVDKESVADRAGLLIGDQILEVNGQSFLDVTHDEAVSQLKYHKRMSLLVRDVGKVPHSCTAYDHRGVDMIWEPLPGASRYGTVSGRNRSAALQMVEEKARTVLPKSDFPTLCYYTDEYTCRRMTVDAFVVVMLELLNTPEKYTLLTELREIIAPEDRVRFDELVYRREGDTRTRDIQREYDVRHSSRRKTGISLAENNHSMLMSSLHDMAGPDYSAELGGYGGCESDQEYRSPSEDSGLGLAVADRASRTTRRPASATPGCNAWYGTRGDANAPALHPPAITNTSDLDEETPHTQDYTSGDETEATSGRRSRRHSSPGDSCSGSATALHQPDYDEDTDQELAHKLSRSFDMKDDQNMLEASGASADSGGANGSGAMRRHQSMQRLSRSGESGTGAGDAATDADSSAATIIPDQHGNLRITVKKSKPILGIAIEGGANTKHPLPRIINIHENGAAFDAGGLEVGQLILEVDGARVEGMQHQEVARLIAESFARRDRNIIEFLVVEAKKSNMEPKPTALIFLEA